MSEIVTIEQAMRWCRERGIAIDLVEGKARLFFRGCLLMEGVTLQEAVVKVKRYSRVAFFAER